MDALETARQSAAALHDIVIESGARADQPLELVEHAARYLGLELSWLEEDDPLLKGARALFDEQSGLICCVSNGDTGTRAILAAHEIGHARLHTGSNACRNDDIDPTRTDERAPVGLQRVEDYGVRERREQQADIFAREFLFPRSEARCRHLSGETATQISGIFSLPLNLVRQQLFDVLLIPEAPARTPPRKPHTRTRNGSQDRAVVHRGSAHLVEAGPGTGKTSTLVDRVVSLIDEKVDPASILVVTFSNRAAGELCERLAAVAPEAAPKIWTGTFHAFGLDLIRRYHDMLDLPNDPALFDRSDAIEALEQILPTLPLNHYRNLWDPALELREILNAISRAKDELVDAKRYTELAQSMHESAIDEASRTIAEKALEVAKIYELYQAALSVKKTVDFGDLIMRPALLLEGDKEIALQLQLRHRHILVDEYQDVNRASARLLRALAGDGQRLWVVGDARQSIYRFRGASSVNMRTFTSEYPDALASQLDVNYRSTPEILSVFSTFAPHMGASRGMLPLAIAADRDASGRKPELRGFDYPEDEVGGLAASIKELESVGVALRDQAVLCRTNGRLNELAAGFEARGIPVLHLGSLFERPEVRDLLSLLSLMVDPFGGGIMRIGALPRYSIPLQDQHHVIAALRSRPGRLAERLPSLLDDPEISAKGQRGLKFLAADVDGFDEKSTAWEFLSTYLLDRTGLLADLVRAPDIREQMMGVAIWQFLNFVRDQNYFGPGYPIQRVLNRVRNLVLLAEERDLRQIPAGALHMNAVRLMTVHGSKGLEFEAVHVPGLTKAGFPASYRGERCPPPDGLIGGVGNLTGAQASRQAHEEEEECLFFVALSRARSHLRIYNSRLQKNGKTRNPSPFLEWLPQAVLGRNASAPTLRLDCDPDEIPPVQISWHNDWKLTHAMIDSYARCPRRFFYTHVVGVGGARKSTPFGQTHDCLYDFIDWLKSERRKGSVSRDAATKELERLWLERGPTDHAFALDYRRLADTLAASLLHYVEGKELEEPVEFPVTFPTGTVVVTPDGTSKAVDGTAILHRIRTGSRRSDEPDHLEYTLYHLAGQARYGQRYIVEALHLSDGIVEPVEISGTKIANRRATSAQIVASVAAGLFPPDPDQVRCPRCPHFFICAACGTGSLKQS